MLNQRVILSTDAMFQQIGGEGVILDLKSASYFGLDDVGTRLWELLQADASLAAAHGQLLDEYDVESSQLEQDLLKLVDQLRHAGLVSIQ